MITLNKMEDLKRYYVEEINTYVFNDDIEIVFNLDVQAHIDAWYIFALNIDALDIYAYNIYALDIDALDINALDIYAGNIKAGNIDAYNIKAGNIDARDINARNINARDISYYGVCFAYKNIECTSIQGSRENSKHFVLDGEITIKPKERLKKTIALELTEEQIEKVKLLLEVIKMTNIKQEWQLFFDWCKENRKVNNLKALQDYVAQLKSDKK